MKQLSKLQSLVEAAGAGKTKSIGGMLLKLEDEVEKAYDAVTKIREKLQSNVITDYLKAEGFPATESKAVKESAEAAYQALRKLEGEMLDLIQAVGIHENPEDFDPKDM